MTLRQESSGNIKQQDSKFQEGSGMQVGGLQMLHGADLGGQECLLKTGSGSRNPPLISSQVAARGPELESTMAGFSLTSYHFTSVLQQLLPL